MWRGRTAGGALSPHRRGGAVCGGRRAVDSRSGASGSATPGMAAHRRARHLPWACSVLLLSMPMTHTH